MKTIILCITMSLLTIGCATTGPSKIQQYAAEKEAELLSKIVAYNCTETSNKTCDTITKEIFEQQAVIKAELCDPQRISVEECRKIWAKMAMSKWENRYPYANFDQVLSQCLAEPVRCNFLTFSGIQSYELKLLHSHNMGIMDAIDRGRAKLAEIEEQDANDRRQRNAAAWAAFGAGLQRQSAQPSYVTPVNKPVSCVSNRIGNQTYTNCN